MNATDWCDCHVHVFGPQSLYPFVSEPGYSQPDTSIEELQAAMKPLGIRRAILIQPSVHGTDNRALTSALRRGGSSFRGIAIVTEDVSEKELEALHEAGIRGIRTQIKKEGGKPLDLAALRRLAARIARLGWHVEVHADVSVIDNVDVLLADFPVPVAIEHMGRSPARLGVETPGFQALLRLLESSNVWVKISGAYITSAVGAPYSDVAPIVSAVLEKASGRAVWGSNWPHAKHGLHHPHALLLELFQKWVGVDLAVRILGENPAHLYDFR